MAQAPRILSARICANCGQRFLYVQIPHIQRVFLNKLSARLDHVTHEGDEHLVRSGFVLRFYAQDRALFDLHRGRMQLFRIHFAEAFEPFNFDAFATEFVQVRT